MVRVGCRIGVGFIALAIVAACAGGGETSAGRFASWVDPFIGTEGDAGQLYPGATWPFGLVKLSPDTEGKGRHAGYEYGSDRFRGFTHLRVGGTGCRGAGGAILMRPGVGVPPEDPRAGEPVRKETESAEPGYYGVTFASGVRADLTVSPRVGFHRYRFPEAEEPWVVVDLGTSYGGAVDAEFEVVGDREIVGCVEAPSVCAKGTFRAWFAIGFDVPFVSFDARGDETAGSPRRRSGPAVGALMRFPEGTRTVRARVGISPVDVAHARAERDGEADGWDFDAQRRRAFAAWDERLGRIEIDGGAREQRTLFYTHLYHSLLAPSIASATDGAFRAPGDPETVRNAREVASDFELYSTWSLWDDVRKYPLISLIDPDTAENIARSLVDWYRRRDRFQAWATGRWPTPSVRHEFAGAVVLDAWFHGLDIGDPAVALRGMCEDADGYDASNCGKRLEKAYVAWIAARFAREIGSDRVADRYEAEALRYRDLWCTEQADDDGVVRGFFTPDGTPAPSVEAWKGGGVYEGNLWHYRWFVPHDIAGLVTLRGGRNALADDLEWFFERDFYMHLNEPDIHAPYLFAWLGRPWLTQRWARRFTTDTVAQRYHNHGSFPEPVVTRIYRADPVGYIPTMDDDTGAMSSWYVCSAIGLFPATPGAPFFVIGSPVFPETRIRVGPDRWFVVRARDVSDTNRYIQSATLDGAPFDRPWIGFEEIGRGGVLELRMSAEPNHEWGASPDSAPPSLSPMPGR